MNAQTKKNYHSELHTALLAFASRCFWCWSNVFVAVVGVDEATCGYMVGQLNPS
jgi:peptide methionine sulfoxide reductase MsrA